MYSLGASTFSGSTIAPACTPVYSFGASTFSGSTIAPACTPVYSFGGSTFSGSTIAPACTPVYSLGASAFSGSPFASWGLTPVSLEIAAFNSSTALFTSSCVACSSSNSCLALLIALLYASLASNEAYSYLSLSVVALKLSEASFNWLLSTLTSSLGVFFSTRATKLLNPSTVNTNLPSTTSPLTGSIVPSFFSWPNFAGILSNDKVTFLVPSISTTLLFLSSKWIS